MDLPEPGEPTSNRLWPPAAAISSARRAPAWPLTSARSGPDASSCGAPASTRCQPASSRTDRASALPAGAKRRATSSRWRARQTSAPRASAASSALSGGSTRRVVASVPAWRSASPMASAPRMARNSPPSDSSPANSWPRSCCASICPLAARMPSAIGRSKRPESLGRSAGARLTVMRLLPGNSSPAFWIAERTRSRASLTSVSASPTSVKLGRPLARCTSTCTGRACSPTKVRLCTKERLMVGSPPHADRAQAQTLCCAAPR